MTSTYPPEPPTPAHSSSPSSIITLTIPTPTYTLSAHIHPSITPTPPSQPPPLIILVHGLLNTRHSRIIRGLTGPFIPYASVLSLDFPGNGSSSGQTSYANYHAETQALRHVVLYTRSLGYYVAGIVGHSKGAAATLLYAAEHNDVPLVVNVAGRFDHTRAPTMRFTKEQQREMEEKGSFVWKTYGRGEYVREYIVRKQDLEERKNLNMAAAACRIDAARTRILTVHGKADETVPVEDAWGFERILNAGDVKCNEVVLVEGAGHSFSSEEEQKGLVEAVSEWVARQWGFAMLGLDGSH